MTGQKIGGEKFLDVKLVSLVLNQTFLSVCSS